MTDLVITGELAERIADLAKQAQRPVQDVLEELLALYQKQMEAQSVYESDAHSLIDFPVDDLGPWPEGLTLRREELYGDDER